MESRRWIMFIMALAFVMLTAEKCPHETHPNAPQPAPPPATRAAEPTNKVPDPREADPEPTPKRIVTIRAGVPERNLRPWTISIVSPDSNPKVIEEPISGPEYSTRVLIPWNSRKPISVEVSPARPGSERGFCVIESGRQSDGPRYIAKGWKVHCSLLPVPF